MTLVIMAAGMGSRFGGLKQIEPIDSNGNFIIDYSIYDAIKCGFDKVVFIIKKENYDIFRETVGSRIESKIKVEYVFQELTNVPEGYQVPETRVKPWGTAHAILCCKDVVKENFAIINSDDFYGYDAYKTISTYLKNKTNDNYAMVGYIASNTLTDNGSVKRGICQIKDNHLEKLTESLVERKGNQIIATPLNGEESFTIENDTPVSMNMFAFTPKIFDYLEERFPNFLEENKDNIDKCEYLIPDVVFEQIKKGMVKVDVLKTTARWYGITYKEDKEQLVKSIKDLVQNGTYPNNLWN